MQIRLFLFLIVFSYSISKVENIYSVQLGGDGTSLQAPPISDPQLLASEVLALIPMEQELRRVMQKEFVDSFLNDPQRVTQSIPKSERRSLVDLLGNRERYPFKDWLCMYHLNGYETGVTLAQANQLGFKKLYFLIVLYERSKVYGPLDIRSNPGLQAIYENLDQEIQDFIYYYVVTPDHSKLSIPSLATAVKNSANFLIRPLRILTD